MGKYLDDKPLSIDEIQVFSILKSYYSQYGVWPSWAVMAKSWGWRSPKLVMAPMLRLESRGLASKTRTGPRHYTLNHLLFDKMFREFLAKLPPEATSILEDMARERENRANMRPTMGGTFGHVDVSDVEEGEK